MTFLEELKDLWQAFVVLSLVTLTCVYFTGIAYLGFKVLSFIIGFLIKV